jgi:hypothetical protein
LVEGEQEGEDVGVLGHGVGGADGGVEECAGVAQGVGAGFVKGAVEVAQDFPMFSDLVPGGGRFPAPRADDGWADAG